MARRKSSPRRRRRSTSTRGGNPFSRRGFLPTGAVMGTASTAGGFILANMLPDKQPIAFFKTGNGRIIGKVIIGAAAFMLARKFAPPAVAGGLAIGALTAAALDVVNKVRAGSAPPVPTIAGMGVLGLPDGVRYRNGLAGGIGHLAAA